MFNQSKYTSWYFSIIENARIQSRQKHERYFENHHVIPKCMNGQDDIENMILLTLREHYICHLLLPNMTDNPNHKIRLLFALSYFKRCFTSSMYERYRIKHSDAMSAMIWVNNHIISKRIHPDELDSYLGWDIGRLYHSRSKKMSLESKARISKANAGKKLGRDNAASKQVTYDSIVYQSLTEAVEKTGLSIYKLKKNGANII